MTINAIKSQILHVSSSWAARYESDEEKTIAVESLVSGIALTAHFLAANDGSVTAQLLSQGVERAAEDLGLEKSRLS